MLTIEDSANFIWMWDSEFFLETNKGNYIWKDPDYNGDNTITSYNGDINQYFRERKIPFGRYKGEHIIKVYCGNNVIIS